MAAAASNVQRVKPLVIAAWVMIGITCLVSLIPGLGFATWLVAAPILFITLVAGIIVMTKGALCMGF